MTLSFAPPSRLLRHWAAPAVLLAASLCGTAASAAGTADEAAQMALGKKLFNNTTPACALCHTLKDAGSEGAIGPAFNDLQPDAARVSKALHDGLGAMPSFKATLTEEQIAALSLYVSKASRLP